MGRAKGTGRKKMEMKKIEKQSSLKVTFCKRRQGLFKKASELCRLYHVNIAIIVFSPGGRLYTFGHPSCDSVINQFLDEQEKEEEEEGFLWEESIEDLDLEELHKYDLILEELRDNVNSKLEEMVLRRTCERDFFGSK